MTTKQPIYQPSASRHQQKGASMLGWLILGALVIFFGILVVKMAPAYLDYGTITTSIEEVLHDSRINVMSVGDIEERISKHLNINNVETINADQLDITKNGGQIRVVLDYNVKKHLFYNVSVVMHFEHTYQEVVGG